MKIFDLHCDTIGECYNKNKALRVNDMHLSLERASKYNCYTQVFAVWIADELRGKDAVDYFNNVADLFYKELDENKDLISLYGNNSDTPVKALLSAEGGSACGGTSDGLVHLYNRGVRIVTLTWNSNNEIGAGAFADGGLTDFGREFIKKADELGIILDVSHLNPQCFKELTELYGKPFIASHSNADIVDNFYGHKRNLSDWQIDVIRERGGLIGLNFCSDFIDNPDSPGVKSLARQIDYFITRGCENILALGSDFDGCDMNDDFSGVHKLSDVYKNLREYGFSEELLNNIFYENAEQFFTKRIKY